MELQLSTQNAQKALDQIEKSLAQLAAAFAGFNGSTTQGLTQTLNALGQFKGLPSGAASSMKEFAAAATKLSNIKDVANIANSLNALAKVNVSGAAASVKELAASLTGIKAPRGLSTLAQSLERIASSANAAVAPINKVASAVNSIQPGTSLRTLAGNITGVGTATRGAASGLGVLSGAASTATTALGAFGISLGVVGIVQFGKSMTDATVQLTRFQNLIDNRTPGAAAQELEYINKAATDLALPLDIARNTYAKLYDTVINSGKSVKDARGIFEGFGKTFTALGLNADQMGRGFKAVEQIMSKGAANAEELRQQLGELFPAFTLLAESMGKSPMELAKMMEAGKVASDVLFKFADDLTTKFGGAAKNAVEGVSGSIIRFQNTLRLMQESFGAGFWDAFLPAFKQLQQAFSSPEMLASIKSFGAAIGTVAGYIAQFVTFLSQNGALVQAAMTVILTALAVPRLISFGQTVLQAGTFLLGFGRAATTAATTASAAGGLLAGFVSSLGSVGRLASLAVVGISTLIPIFSPLGITVGLVAGAISLLVSYGPGLIQMLFGWMTGASQTATETTKAATATSAAAVATNDAATATARASTETSSLTGFITSLFGAQNNTAASSQKLSGGLVQVEKSSGTAANAAVKVSTASDQMAGAADKASTNVGKLATETTKGASSSQSMAIGLERSEQAANRAALAYEKAAKSAQKLATAQSKVKYPGGGEDGDKTSSNSFAGGGISTQGNGRSMSVPTSAFIGAPMFASGGTTGGGGGPLPGGGIPAVLHPNEAVIPLSGGGAVPVELSSDQQGSAAAASAPSPRRVQGPQTRGSDAADELIRLVRLSYEAGVRLSESVDMQTTLSTQLHQITNELLRTVAENVMTVSKEITNLGDRLSKISTTSAASSNSDASTPATTNNVTNNFSGGLGSSGSGGVGNTFGEAGGGIGFDFNKEFRAKYSLTGYATGSPNVSKDETRGAYNVTVHDDEAIIPLPDGRTVPVTLPSRFDDMLNNVQQQRTDPQIIERETIEKTTEPKTAAPAGQSEQRPVVVNLTMNVTTPDADSFRASKIQIMRDFEEGLSRAGKVAGRSALINDPTKRTV